jgi:predicted nucleic acid-binding protein
MIVYLDSSALVKRYILEANSAEVEQLVSAAEQVGAAIISRAEVSAALSKAVRLNWIDRAAALKSLAVFQSQWPSLFRLHIRETTVARADALAWAHRLRGYDAVHLACALLWQDAVGEAVTLATFDEALHDAAAGTGLAVWPEPFQP